jgi:hypothetical protein
MKQTRMPQDSIHVRYISKLCRAQAEVILYHANPNVCGTGKGEAMHRKYKEA